MAAVRGAHRGHELSTSRVVALQGTKPEGTVVLSLEHSLDAGRRAAVACHRQRVTDIDVVVGIRIRIGIRLALSMAGVATRIIADTVARTSTDTAANIATSANTGTVVITIANAATHAIVDPTIGTAVDASADPTVIGSRSLCHPLSTLRGRRRLHNRCRGGS